MQSRQQIREQFGILEEQLEELGALAFNREIDDFPSVTTDLLLQETMDSVRELSRLVHEQQLLKSVTAHEFLLRVCGLLVQDAAQQGLDLSISHFGEGRISMEMAELVLGAIVAGFRASLKGLKTLTRAQRVKSHLFATGSVYLEVRATSGEIQFRLLDDGQAFGGEDKGDRRFLKLRDNIARCGGWFTHRAFSPCGGMIEFKVPLAHNRTQALVLRGSAFEVLVPSACVGEVLTEGRPPANAPVYRLDEIDGLVAKEAGENFTTYVRACVADFQFWIGCDSVSAPVQVRKAAAGDFVEEGCWMRSLGLFLQEGVGQALPLLDGPSLVQFRRLSGGDS